MMKMTIVQDTLGQLIHVMNKQIDVLSKYKDLAEYDAEAKDALVEIDNDLISNVSRLDYFLDNCVFSEEHFSVLKDYRKSSMELAILYKEWLALQ